MSNDIYDKDRDDILSHEELDRDIPEDVTDQFAGESDNDSGPDGDINITEDAGVDIVADESQHDPVLMQDVSLEDDASAPVEDILSEQSRYYEQSSVSDEDAADDLGDEEESYESVFGEGATEEILLEEELTAEEPDKAEDLSDRPKTSRSTYSSSKPEGYDYRYARPEKKRREKGEKARSKPIGLLLIISCLIVSLIGSYVGGYYGMRNAMKDSGGTVLYQSVQRVDKEGNGLLTELSVEDTADLVKDSVVEIRTETVVESFFVQQYVTEGAGSGVIISEDGYIVTNNHVIEGVSTIKVRTVDGTEYVAELIGTDSRTDLAVIKVEAADLKAAVFGLSQSLNVGQGVVAVGNPLGELGGTVTDGIVSALGRELTIENQKMTLLQTNAAVNPGNSGGGLFNLYGELIGIVNAKSSGSGIEGLGFAIPIDDAKAVIEQLIDVGYVSGRAYMGVTLLDINDYITAASYRVNKYGVYILEVEEDSAADKAGLRAGDYVVAIDDTQISTSAEIIEIVGSKSVGDVFTMFIERNGVDMSMEIVLGEYIPTGNIN